MDREALKMTVPGLVLREVKYGEADRILTLLTPDGGIVSAMAKGSLRPKNKLFSACGLYSYSEWTLRDGKNMYWVDEASPIEVFFGLRGSIEALSLAAYIAELLQILSPTGTEAAELLRLALNSFYLLAEGRREPEMVKAVFELRSLSEAGFMPDLSGCAACGEEPQGRFFFDVRQGGLLCENCAAARELAPNADPAILKAMRHIVESEQAGLFSFALGAQNQQALGRLAESFLLFNLDYPPKSLGFLKTIFGQEEENPPENPE